MAVSVSEQPIADLAAAVGGTGLDPVAFLAALDDEPTLPCAGTVHGGQPCPRAADWGARCSRCGHDMHACTPHREHADHLVADHGAIAVCGSPLGGGACRWQYPTPIPWRAV